MPDVASEREAARCSDSKQKFLDFVEYVFWTKLSGANVQGH